MTERNNGGPAFPRPRYRDPVNDDIIFEQEGLSLRDYFAGQALVGLCREEVIGTATAELAYQMADAMLKERDK